MKLFDERRYLTLTDDSGITIQNTIFNMRWKGYLSLTNGGIIDIDANDETESIVIKMQCHLPLTPSGW